MKDSHLFKLARECSLKSDYKSGCSNAKIGTIVVYKGTVLAKGYNSDKTHTAQAKFNKLRYNAEDNNNYLPEKCHSEITALTKIKYLDIDFSKVHIYNYRELKNGKIAMARPCPACMAFIREMGIKNVHYTNDNSYCFERLR